MNYDINEILENVKSEREALIAHRLAQAEAKLKEDDFVYTLAFKSIIQELVKKAFEPVRAELQMQQTLLGEESDGSTNWIIRVLNELDLIEELYMSSSESKMIFSSDGITNSSITANNAVLPGDYITSNTISSVMNAPTKVYTSERAVNNNVSNSSPFSPNINNSSD